MEYPLQHFGRRIARNIRIVRAVNPQPRSLRMSLARSLFVLTLALVTTALPGQSTLPTALQPLPARTLVSAGTTITIDLREYFSLPGVTGQVVQYDTVMGKFNVELLANAAPQHAMPPPISRMSSSSSTILGLPNVPSDIAFTPDWSDSWIVGCVYLRRMSSSGLPAR